MLENVQAVHQFGYNRRKNSTFENTTRYLGIQLNHRTKHAIKFQHFRIITSHLNSIINNWYYLFKIFTGIFLEPMQKIWYLVIGIIFFSKFDRWQTHQIKKFQKSWNQNQIFVSWLSFAGENNFRLIYSWLLCIKLVKYIRTLNRVAVKM